MMDARREKERRVDMSRTYRNVPNGKHMRTPQYRWKLRAGIPRKSVTTDWDDKPIAANREIHGISRNFVVRFPDGYKQAV
jgi:hypothetical protein